MKNLIKIVFCYLPILIGASMYEEAVLVNLFIGFVCFIMGIVITISASDMKQFKMLHLHLFLGTILGQIVSGYLFVVRVSSDSESIIIIEGIVILAVIMYIFMYVIEYFIKRSILKNKKQ